MISEGPNSPSAAADDTSVGTLGWINHSDCYTSNDVRAYTQSLAGACTSYYLYASGFGFNIPSDSIVDGIKVEVERQANVGTIDDAYIKLFKAGSPVGDNKETDDIWSNGSDEWVTYGGEADLWGASWSPSDINNSGFGIGISCKSTDTGRGYIDHVKITVYYTLAGKSGIAIGYPMIF